MTHHHRPWSKEDNTFGSIRPSICVSVERLDLTYLDFWREGQYNSISSIWRERSIFGLSLPSAAKAPRHMEYSPKISRGHSLSRASHSGWSCLIIKLIKLRKLISHSTKWKQPTHSRSIRASTCHCQAQLEPYGSSQYITFYSYAGINIANNLLVNILVSFHRCWL